MESLEERCDDYTYNFCSRVFDLILVIHELRRVNVTNLNSEFRNLNILRNSSTQDSLYLFYAQSREYYYMITLPNT